MAKQSGLHQIKGKVGEYSYYKQTGVSGGLIRSINQGLSARVKNDEAFANTRLNNQEFGAASNVAALLGQCVTPKFRPMILPFSQSKMAREILDVAREHTVNWGQRVVTSEDTARLCEILSAMSKRASNEFLSISMTRSSATAGEITASFSAEQATLMSSLGISGVTIRSAIYNIATGQWVPLAKLMTTGYIENGDVVYPFNKEPVISGERTTQTASIDIDTFVPAPNHSGHRILVSVIMPVRSVGSVDHVLQEYCSFVAMPLPEYVP